ncbi:MAG: DinB family protein [Phycisphaerales bacterium]
MAAIDPSDLNGDVSAILLAHSRSADEELLAACRPLTDEQLDRPFEMGPGTLRKLLMHNLGAVRIWADIYRGGETRPWLPDEGMLDVPGMERTATALHDEWVELASRFDLGEMIERTFDGTTRRHTRAHIIAHVTTHSVHHRAQAINMLRQMGVEQRPTGSVLSWVCEHLKP